jgi:hypothetical protein
MAEPKGTWRRTAAKIPADKAYCYISTRLAITDPQNLCPARWVEPDHTAVTVSASGRCFSGQHAPCCSKS